MAEWKIFYDDGSVFTDKDGAPIEAPAFGVQAIACYPEVWRGGDFVGLIDFLAHNVGAVKFGRLTSNEKYHAAVTAAREDTDIHPERYIHERADFYWYCGEE